MGTEIVDVYITRPAMRFKLEMMMFDILQAVAHFRFTGADGLGPEDLTVALDARFARNGLELLINHQLRAERAGSEL